MNIYQNMNYKKDECYTTKAEAVKLINYLTVNQIINYEMLIWLPFDNELSNLYQGLKLNGYNTILSNLENGQDFYFYEPKYFNIIITNPPFSDRTKLIKRLVHLNKPFIILQATQFFNNQNAVKTLCLCDDFKFIMPEKRMKFLLYNSDENKIKAENNRICFYSFWLCYKTKLKNTFNLFKNSGSEQLIEEFDLSGNIIVENHYNLINLIELLQNK